LGVFEYLNGSESGFWCLGVFEQWKLSENVEGWNFCD
jgi:hypothetical protein